MGGSHHCRSSTDAVESAKVGVEKFDIRTAEVAAMKPKSSSVRALGKVSELADQPPLIAASVLTITAGMAFRSSRLTSTGVQMLASHLLATGIKTILKNRIDRTRPSVLLDDGEYHFRPGSSGRPQESSFPSGHTAGAAAVASAIEARYPVAGKVALCTAVAVGAVQIPRKRHYVSDVMAGGIVGLIADRLVRIVTKRNS